MAKYVILESSDKDELSRIVNKNLETGWICRGGAVIDDGVFYQTISHDSDGAEAYMGDDNDEDSEMEESGVCGICGEEGCSNPIHAKLAGLANILGELKKVKI